MLSLPCSNRTGNNYSTYRSLKVSTNHSCPHQSKRRGLLTLVKCFSSWRILQFIYRVRLNVSQKMEQTLWASLASHEIRISTWKRQRTILPPSKAVQSTHTEANIRIIRMIKLRQTLLPSLIVINNHQARQQWSWCKTIVSCKTPQSGRQSLVESLAVGERSSNSDRSILRLAWKQTSRCRSLPSARHNLTTRTTMKMVLNINNINKIRRAQ